MKFVIAIVGFFLLVFAATSYAQTDDRLRRNIKGNVVSVTEYTYKVTYSANGYSRGNCTDSIVLHFNSDGNQISTSGNDFTYDYNTSFQTTTLVFQPTGRITINDRKRIFTINRADAKFVCTYKQNIHRPTSAKYYPCRGCRRQEGRTAIFKYDKQGNVVKINSYISQIEVNGDYLSSCDAEYSPAEKYGLTFEYEYDQLGNWIIKRCYNALGMMTEWKEREYKYAQNTQYP